MKLIVGLGNPGAQYANTRHNVGFMVADQIATTVSASWKSEDKFKALVATSDLDGEKLMLAKPQTFMNLSGESIQRIAQFYKIAPADIWVIFDDVDTEFGRLRIRHAGGSGGHQGVKSTISHLGPDFTRVKVGISLNDRHVEPSEEYVLKPFAPHQQKQLPALISAASQITLEQLSTPTPEPASFDLLQ